MGILIVLALGGCAEPPPRAVTFPDIVLISMDTMRADRLGAWGNPDRLTPNLDAFAAEAVVFDQAYAHAIQTAPSHASLFSSRYPVEVQGQGRQPWFTDATPTLAQVLAAYGYQAGAFVGGADLSPHMGLTRGFETYESSASFGSLHHTTAPALAWLDARDRSRPAFAFVHGYDCHSRYLKPPPWGYSRADAAYEGPGQEAVRTATERIVDGRLYSDFFTLLGAQTVMLRPRSRVGRESMARQAAERSGAPTEIGEADVALVRGVYDGAVAYADAHFGLLMAGLQARGLLDSAVIVVLSDHGEGLGEDGLFGHCCDVTDAEAQVALMVRMPGGKGGGRRFSGLVGLIDVAPTLYELAGAMAPAGIKGQSLASVLRGEPFGGRETVLTEAVDAARIVSVRSAAGRLSYTGVPATSRHLPDIVEAARLEGTAFSGTAPADARAALRTAMVATLRTIEPADAPSAEPLPPQLKEELREKGYWQVGP